MDRPAGLWPVVLTTLMIGLILAVADLLIVTLWILLLIFAGLLFGIFLNGISRWLARFLPIPYRACYTIVVAVLLGLTATGLYHLGWQLAEQATTLRSELQSTLQELIEQVRQYEWAQQYLPQDSESQKGATGSGIVMQVLRGVQWIGWAVLALLVTFFVGVYVAYDPDLYKTGLVKLVPPDQRDTAVGLLRELNYALGHWMVGRLISMSIIGVFTAIGLWLLGVPLPITLGILAGLLTFIPNLGPVLATLPQALVALEVGPTTMLYVILLNLVLQTLEGYFVTPVVQRYEVSLPPALTIFAQLLMGALLGVIGIMLAAPLVAATMVLVQMLYIRDRLGDPASD